MINRTSLQKIGLTKKEATIYLLLLENGILSLKDIVKRCMLAEEEARIVVKDMVNKRYVGFIMKEDKIHFCANHEPIGMLF